MARFLAPDACFDVCPGAERLWFEGPASDTLDSRSQEDETVPQRFRFFDGRSDSVIADSITGLGEKIEHGGGMYFERAYLAAVYAKIISSIVVLRKSSLSEV